MTRLIHDESGTLQLRTFYEIFIAEDVEPEEGWLVAKLSPGREELFLASQDADDGWVFLADAGDLCGGCRVSHFISTPNPEEIVSPREFAERLVQLGFSGLKLSVFEIEVNQSSLKNPDFLRVWFTGRNCLRTRRLVDGRNECPRCGYSPLICADCALDPIKCARCNFVFYVPAKMHRGAGDIRLPAFFDSQAAPILEGRLWDGSDFIGCPSRNFVSKRVVDWLLSVHAAPFYARPAPICIDGMPDEQLAKLETMTQPLPLER